MYERTRFGTTPHSQKVVQDSDAYDQRADWRCCEVVCLGQLFAVRAALRRHLIGP
jgi:hypothetical protein